MKAIRYVAALVLLNLCFACTVQADLLVTITATGNDVVVTSSGTIDTSGLFFVHEGRNGGSVQPTSDQFAAAGVITGTPFDFNTNPTLDAYILVGADTSIGPMSFGGGSWRAPDFGSGVTHGFNVLEPALGNDPLVWLPDGYQSGEALEAEMVYTDTSLHDLGVSIGVYDWAYADNNVRLIISVPEPGAVPIMVLGLAFLGNRRKRN